MKKSDFLRHETLVQNGAWMPTSIAGVSLKVRGINSNEAQRFFATKEYEALNKKDKDAAANLLVVEVLLLDWKGIDDESGAPLAFSRADAEDLVATKAFRGEVLDASTRLGQDIASSLEVATKN